MSPDSIDQWGQIVSTSFNDWHPAFYTMVMWLTTRIWDSPASVAILQVIAMSAIIGMWLAAARSAGAAPTPTWAACAALCASPVTGLLVITLWKDIAYTIVFLALTLLLYMTFVSDGSYLDHKWTPLSLGCVAALLALFRHDGIIVAFPALILLGAAYRQHLRRVILAGVVLATIVFIVRGPLYRIGRVSTEGLEVNALSPLIHQVAAHVSAGTPMDRQDRAYLTRLRSLDEDWPYRCYVWDDLFYDGQFNRKVIEANPGQFLRLYLRLLRTRPVVNLVHMACSGSLVWRVTQPADGYLSTVPLRMSEDGTVNTIAPNQFGLKTSPFKPRLATYIARQIIRSQTSAYSWLLWRPALYVYAAIWAAAIGLPGRHGDRRKSLIVMAPLIFHSGFHLFLTVSQDLRYMFPAYVLAILLLPFLFRRSQSSDALESKPDPHFPIAPQTQIRQVP